MNPIAISIFGLSITWYSIFIVSGMLLAGILISIEAKKHNIEQSFVSNLVFWCIVFGIIGARVYYVLFNLDYYSIYPMEIVKIWNGGLAIHGGLIAGTITLLVYCRKYNVNPLKMIDIAIPYVILAQAIGRWGNFFNQEAHGGVVTKAFLQSIHIPNFIIKGMYMDGSYYHPAFFYESICCLFGFIILMLLKSLKGWKVGNTISVYMIWYGITRFFIESLRTDSLMLGTLKMAQVISVIMIISGIIMFIITSIKCERYNDIKTSKKSSK